MNNPKLYAQTNGLTHKEVREFLEEYLPLVRWRQDGGGSAMDIGCGPGSITTQILLPMLPDSLRQLVATDISPQMIQYARKHHQHPRIIYDVLDIGTKKLPQVYHERFDQVFSLFCLHLVQDQRQAMQNIFDMLQPGGDMLLVYFATHACCDVVLKLASLEHWKPYMKDARRRVVVYQNVENVQELLHSLLREVGYEDITCKCRRKEYVYENMDVLLHAVTGVNPYIAQLPAHLKKKYLHDLRTEHMIQAYTEGYTRNGTDSIYYPYSLIMIHARKP